MRNALILIGVVVFVIVVGGALNHAVAFDIDYVFGSWTAVSMFWIALAVAAVVAVVGLLCAWFARSAAVRSQDKLEGELEGTYERLRAAEAAAPRVAEAATSRVEEELAETDQTAAWETRDAKEDPAPPGSETPQATAPSPGAEAGRDAGLPGEGPGGADSS